MKHKLSLLIAAAALLMGCSQSRTPQPDPTLAIFDIPPVVTATVPGVPSPQVTVTPTLRVPETLTMAEAMERLDPFHSPIAPDGCVLPCYNGLVMGTSTHHDVYEYFALMGVGLIDLIPGDFEDFRYDGTGRLGAPLTKTRDAEALQAQGITAPVVNVYLVDYVTEAVYISWSTYPAYLSMPQILTELGEPASIRLGMLLEEDPIAYLLEMSYPSRQTVFILYGNAISSVDTQRVCVNGDQVYAVSMLIVKPGLTPEQQLSNIEYLLPIMDTLGMTNADFAAAMNSTGCVDVPASTWGAWQNIGQ